jgi:hypothetical protein
VATNKNLDMESNTPVLTAVDTKKKSSKKRPSKLNPRRLRYYRLMTLRLRRFRSLFLRSLKYYKLFIRPAIFACFSVFVWLKTHKVSFYFKDDERYFEYTYAFFAGIHALIAGLQISFASQRKQKMQQAVTLRNEQMFKEYSCIRISSEIVVILVATSLSLYILLILYPFATINSGVTFTFMTMFVLCLMWECAVEMTDPFKGISKITRKEYQRIFPKKEEKMVA